MNRFAGFLLSALVAFIHSFPSDAGASSLPSGGTLRWTFIHSASATEFAAAPALVGTWSKGKNAALWSGVTYLHEDTRWLSGVRFTGENSRPFVRYLPLSVGLRAYNLSPQGRPRGPFLEVGPSLIPAWYRSQSGGSGFAMMGGLQAGVGISLPTIAGSRAEFGTTFYVAEAFGQARDAGGRIGTPNEVDVQLFTAYLALGLGD